jgi:rod shape-determining protein MreC
LHKFYTILLGVLLFIVINIPDDRVDSYRSKVISWISPLWKSCAKPIPVPLIENAIRYAQVDILQERLFNEQRLLKEAEQFASWLQVREPEKLAQDTARKMRREKYLLASRYSSMSAEVVFRDPSSWSSALWIGLGEVDNRAIGQTVIGLNSPVLSNRALVGVVDYVGETQSRVRLIGDAGLTVAVRVLRGGAQNRELSYVVADLLGRAELRPELFVSPEERNRFIDMLSIFKVRLQAGTEEELAKGEISGSSTPSWKAQAMLKGKGFNYDFSDEAGPSRDLRSEPSMIREGDLLVTSGLDGIFPPGIPVAIAGKIAPLEEQSFAYELVAIPAATCWADLRIVSVLPPIAHRASGG